MSGFQLDTSGVVYVLVPGMMTERPRVWSDLDPFTQGYIEALLTDPACSDELVCDEGGCGFSDLAPETLARIMEDCAKDRRVGRSLNLAGNAEDRTSKAAGAAYWRERQTSNLLDAPPLTPILSDDGKVVFA